MQRRRSGAGGGSRPAPIGNTFCWPVLAAALLLTAGLAACADVRAAWYFDEGSGQTVADSSGNGNNGTLGPTIAVETNDPTWTTGKYSNALSYDGSNDYVRVPDSATLDVTSSLTIEAWVSPAVSTPYGYLVYKGGMSGAKETPLNYGLNTNVSGGQTVLEFRFRDSGGTLRVFSGLQGLINTANAWYFVAATYDDASDSVVLRVDNTTQSFTTTATMVANGEPLFVGARSNGTLSWNGRIDTTVILNNAGLAERVLRNTSASNATLDNWQTDHWAAYGSGWCHDPNATPDDHLYMGCLLSDINNGNFVGLAAAANHPGGSTTRSATRTTTRT